MGLAMNLETKEIAKISTVKIIGDVQTHLPICKI